MAAQRRGEIPDPNQVVTYDQTNIYGQSIRMGRRTAAHLDWTKQKLERRHPGCRLVIIQGCYNTGVDASEGTHDKDCVLDIQISGLDWWDAQRFLRECGWGAFYRYPPSFSNHIHMISLGYGDAPVGYLIPSQVDDYRNHKTGLEGHAYDPTWHPSDIASTIFRYADYIRSQEDDMPTPKDLLDAKVNGDDDVRAALRASLRTEQKVGQLLSLLPRVNTGFRNIHAALDDLEQQAGDDATKQQVANVRSRVADAEKAIADQIDGIAKEGQTA